MTSDCQATHCQVPWRLIHVMVDLSTQYGHRFELTLLAKRPVTTAASP